MMSLRITEQNEVIASLRKIIFENPSDAWAHSRLGAAYQDAGLLVAAVAQLQKAIALVPDFPLPYRQLAEIYRSLGDVHLAGYYREKAEELVLKANALAETWRVRLAPSRTELKEPPRYPVGATGSDQSNCPITPA